MDKNQKIYVAGHTGLVGSAICRELTKRGYSNVIVRTRKELDLLNQSDTARFFKDNKPEVVFQCAGKVGGLYANDTYRADFIYENIQIETNVIHHAYLNEVRKLIFFGCSSMYPKTCPQPMKEEHLLSGKPEPTNEPFAMAKLAGMKMCESYSLQYGADFITIIPTNLFGIRRNHGEIDAFVIPSMLRKFHQAKVSRSPSVTVWGSGRPARDFLFADNLADAAIFLAGHYQGIEPINVGTGRDYTIREVADLVKSIVGYEGEIVFDRSKIEGVLIKLQDVSRLRQLGWKHKIDFEEGIRITYEDFLKQHGQAR